MASINLQNRIYYLCIEDRYAATIIAEWLYHYKETPLNLRDARKNVEGSFVLVMKDQNGDNLRFIERIAQITHARIEIR